MQMLVDVTSPRQALHMQICRAIKLMRTLRPFHCKGLFEVEWDAQFRSEVRCFLFLRGHTVTN